MSFSGTVSIAFRQLPHSILLLTHPLREEAAYLVMVRVRGPRLEDFLNAMNDSRFQTLLAQ